MLSKSENIEIMICDKVDTVIQDFFESLLSRHQTGLEESTKGSNSIYDCVKLLHSKCHKTILKRGGSYRFS